MSDYIIRKAQTDDLPIIQQIARRTIDKSYRPFLGDDGVDGFINSGESDEEVKKNLEHCDVLIYNGNIVAFTIYFDDLIHSNPNLSVEAAFCTKRKTKEIQ